MDIFDTIKSVFSQKSKPTTAKNPIITMSYSIVPMRLKAYSSEKVSLTVNLEFLSDSPSVCSLVIGLQTGLSFDTTNINKRKEIRLGELEPSEKKTIETEIYSTVNTPPGAYKVTLTGYVHDSSYNQVLRSFEKTFEIRVV